jgi:hypothetical protein
MTILGADMEEEERPIAEMFGRILDDGKAYAKAEANLARVKVEAEVDRFRRPALFAGIAAAFALAGIIALIVTLVLAFASWLGPLLGGLIATAIAFAVAVAFGLAAKNGWSAKP